jgi:hypothetical protein
MRALILVAGAALAVSACSSNESADNTMNVDTIEANTIVSDMNAVDLNAMDANMTMDANTANLVAEDMTSNTPDANLANGI